MGHLALQPTQKCQSDQRRLGPYTSVSAHLGKISIRFLSVFFFFWFIHEESFVTLFQPIPKEFSGSNNDFMDNGFYV